MKKFIFIFIMSLFASEMVMAGDAVLNWPASPPEENVIGYTVYWFKTSEPATIYNQTVAVNTLTLEENLFEVDEDYSFYVIAYNSAGESPQSDIVNGVIRGGYTPPVDNLPGQIIIVQPGKLTITVTVE